MINAGNTQLNNPAFSGMYAEKQTKLGYMLMIAARNDLVNLRYKNYFKKRPFDNVIFLENENKVNIKVKGYEGTDKFIPSQAHIQQVNNSKEAQTLLHQVFNYLSKTTSI